MWPVYIIISAGTVSGHIPLGKPATVESCFQALYIYIYDFNVRMPVAYRTTLSFFRFCSFGCFLGGFAHSTGQEIHDSETIVTGMSMQARPRVQCGN